MKAPAIAICLLALPSLAFADAAALLDPAVEAQLESGAMIARGVPAGQLPTLLPAVSARPSILAEYGAVRPTIGAEALRLIRADPSRLALYDALHAVSAMEGLTYWSVTQGRQSVLFTTSYAVAGPKDLTRVADPRFTAIPRTDELYSLQVDQHFGRHVYRSVYLDAGDCFEVKIENTDPIAWLLFPIAAPGNLVTLSVAVPTPQGVLLAGVSWMKASVPIPDRAGRELSLANRLVAMSNWLARQLGSLDTRERAALP